jgi:hypothetical protein
MSVAAVTAALDELEAAYKASDATAPTSRERKVSYRAVRVATDNLFAARYAARDAFARARGWNPCRRRTITLNQLRAGRLIRQTYEWHWPEVDHANGFTVGRGWGAKPAGIVSHSYAPFAECQAFADCHGLNAELLPESWHLPGWTIAVLFTRKPS